MVLAKDGWFEESSITFVVSIRYLLRVSSCLSNFSVWYLNVSDGPYLVDSVGYCPTTGKQWPRYILSYGAYKRSIAALSGLKMYVRRHTTVYKN